VIGGSELLRLLRLVSEGNDPDMVYAEAYANADIEKYDKKEEDND
jgi:hypothetical protein